MQYKKQEDKKKYKVTNKLECNVRFGKIVFGPKETKILDFNPGTEGFDIEELNSEKSKSLKGGK